MGFSGKNTEVEGGWAGVGDQRGKGLRAVCSGFTSKPRSNATYNLGSN